MTEAFCMHCKKKQTIRDEKLIEYNVKGVIRHRLSGVCSVCGTKVSKLVKSVKI